MSPFPKQEQSGFHTLSIEAESGSETFCIVVIESAQFNIRNGRVITMQGRATFWSGIALTFGAIAAILAYWRLALDLPHGFALLLILFAAGIGLATYGTLRSRLAQLEAAQSSSIRDLKESEQRFAAQREAITELMERQARTIPFEDHLRDILETCSRTLGVARSSVWKFAEDRTGISCLDLYEETAQRHSSGISLPRSGFPNYFRAIETERLVAAAAAHTDPFTREFTESYLKPNNISSMLDIPLHQNETVAGVLCLEHTGPMRNWTADEQSFALAIANLLVVALTDRDRRDAAQRLTESEHRARLVVDTAHDAFIGMNSEGKIVSWNAQAVGTFGWTREEAIGKTLAETIIPPAFRESHIQGLRHFLQSGEAPVVNQRLELSALHQSGTEFPIEITITSPVRSDNGYFFGAFARDISLRKEREQELRQAKESAEAATRAKSEFLANMSHELRTPLNGVLGYAQLLQRNSTLTADQRESLDAISKCGSHLLDLINDILDLSKIEAGHMELEPAPTDIHQLTVDLAHVIAEPARRKGLHFSVDIDPEVPSHVVVDGRHIRQVLLNLLGNSVKFTPAGTVCLLVSQTGTNRLEFRVTDTGIGIEPENLKTIFEEFRQTKRGSAAGGSGLGLAISQKLVRAMGGELSVESRLNEGSSFFFDLPLIAAESSSVSAPDDNLPSPGARLSPDSHLMALVVDDSTVNRRILASLLESAGAQVIAAESGVEALDLSAKYHPNVILMDLRMPQMDGLETTRRIRANPETASIPVMMVTASAFGDARRAALDAGCIDFVSKPIRAEQLFQKLQHHLNVRFVDVEEALAYPKNALLPRGLKVQALGKRLFEAASIGRVADLDSIALDLAQGDAMEANLGRRIKNMAASFDFNSLLELAEAMRISE
jgi:PAS domain S-box-containing protein